MNIFNHLLPDDAILGIGPLMIECDPYSTEYTLYGRMRYKFDLHLSAHTTSITSDWFFPKENADERQKKLTWQNQYYVIRKKIAVMMNEPEEELPSTAGKAAMA